MNFPGEVGTEGGKPFHLLPGSSQLFLEYNILEFLHPGFKGYLAVLLEEKHTVLKARPQNPLVAHGDNALVTGDVIADGDEVVHELLAVVDHGEIALMGSHGGYEDFPRKGQVPVFEGPRNDHRVFHEVGDFVHKALIPDRLATHLLGSFHHAFLDNGAPLILVEDHFGLLYLPEVVLDVLYLEGTGRHEAMSVHEASRFNALKSKGNDVASV